MSTAYLWMRTLSPEELRHSGLWLGVQMGGEQGSLGTAAPGYREWQVPGQCWGEADHSPDEKGLPRPGPHPTSNTLSQTPP